MKATFTLQNNPTISWNMQRSLVETKRNFYLLPIFLHGQRQKNSAIESLSTSVSFSPNSLKQQTFEKWSDSSLALNEFASIILDINEAGPTNLNNSRNLVWHNILSKKTVSVHTYISKFQGSTLNRRKRFTKATKPDFLLSIGLTCSSGQSWTVLNYTQLLVQGSFKTLISAWEDSSSSNTFKIKTHSPKEPKALVIQQFRPSDNNKKSNYETHISVCKQIGCPKHKSAKEAVEQKTTLRENAATTESLRLLHKTWSVIWSH